ncbi:MAG: ATP-binding protein [Phycisphaeraceae bacterium]|nr:ATP-binding protein [Phycisphaeraceae bacterium]
MTQRPEISLQMLSNPLFLSGARELVANVARRMGFTEEACGQMALAVDEALCNVIRHGYSKKPDQPIWLSLSAVGGLASPDSNGESPTEALKIVIEDEARQVDLETIKSRDLDEIRPGGLGVHIIREVMDEVSYEHRSPRGMRLTMIKRRTPAGGGQAQPSTAES